MDMERILKGTKVRDTQGQVGVLVENYTGDVTAFYEVGGQRKEAHSSKLFLMDGRSLTQAIGKNRYLLSKQPDAEGLAELLSATSSPAERAILMQRAAPKVAMAGQEWGLRWKEWNAKGQLVTKEKFFATDEARTKFIEKLEQKDNFHMVESFSDPRTGMHAGQPQVAMAQDGFQSPNKMHNDPEALRLQKALREIALQRDNAYATYSKLQSQWEQAQAAYDKKIAELTKEYRKAKDAYAKGK